MMNNRDLVVIGGGAGGLVVASVAAQLGLKVTLIEKQSELGGDCLHFGCVPSKALLKSAHVAHSLRQAGRYGFRAVEPETRMNSINAVVQDAIDTIQVHDSHERFRSLGCEVLTGEPVFIDDHIIELAGQRITAKKFVIATGSTATVPPIPGLGQCPYLTNEDLFSLEYLPEHLIIIGAGAVGIEMAQAFARLGSRVSVVEQNTRILPAMDAEVAACLGECLTEEGVQLILDNGIERVEHDADSKTLVLGDGRRVSGDQLLVATGRSPVVEGLGLDNAGIDYSARGIVVNNRMQTSRRHIYACGDVTGRYQFTHMAEQQAGVVIANAIFRFPKRISYDLVPSVVFTDPECAQVGLSPQDASQDPSVEIVRFDMKELDRAIAEHSTAGFVKLMVKKGRLVGAQVIAPHGGDTIHELALAIQEKTKLSRLAGLIHAYPSYAQMNRRAASQYFGRRLYNQRTRRLVSFLNRWF